MALRQLDERRAAAPLGLAQPARAAGIAAAVATSGDLHATDAPHEDPALLPGFDAPESFELENVLAVPMRAKHTGHAFGVLQALNRRHAGAEVAVGAADAPMRYATARQHTGLDLSGAIDDGRAAVAIDSVAADARKLAEWERARCRWWPMRPRRRSR